MNDLEHFNNQRPFDPMQPAGLVLVRLSVYKAWYYNSNNNNHIFGSFLKYLRAGDQKHIIYWSGLKVGMWFQLSSVAITITLGTEQGESLICALYFHLQRWSRNLIVKIAAWSLDASLKACLIIWSTFCVTYINLYQFWSLKSGDEKKTIRKIYKRNIVPAKISLSTVSAWLSTSVVLHFILWLTTGGGLQPQNPPP